MKTNSLSIFSIQVFLILIPNLMMAQPIIHDVVTNETDIGKYQMIELTVDLSANYTNPFDYSHFNLKAIFAGPAGIQDTVDGFYCQDFIITDTLNGWITANGNPKWKIRFTPTEVGNWQYHVFCIDNDGTSNIITQSFSCVSSDSKGFVRKANDRYMKFDDGSQYFAIGANYGWWQQNAIVNYRTWLDSLTSYGGNFIRTWMASWSFGIEWKDTGLGNYINRQDRAFFLDWLLQYSEQKNVCIELCLNNHGQVSTTVNPEWVSNPYNVANGGPCINTWDFFTNQEAKQFYKNRIRYIIARWGYAPSILSWEKFNEVEWTDNFAQHASEITQWTNEMANYIKMLDVNDHLVSTSYANELNDPATWQLPVIDYSQTHYYSRVPDIENVLYAGTTRYLDEYNKPTKTGEYGIEGEGDSLLIIDPSGINIHNVSWCTAFSGTFGIGISWSWDKYIHPQQIYRQFKPLSDFISTINLLSDQLSPINFECQSDINTSFLFKPMYMEWKKSPSNDFTITTNGVLVPGAVNLGRYLFGNLWNTEYRNPPIFHVNYRQVGTFSVRTAGTSGYSPTIEIWLDGILKLSVPAIINSTYSINVPVGSHTILVDNKGTDWIEISDFNLDNYIPIIKSNALVNSRSTYGWVHNRNYNWKYVNEIGIPDTVYNGKIIVNGLDDGIYTIEWFDCQTGNNITTTWDSSINGSMKIACPDLVWDCAYKSTYFSPLGIETNDLNHIDIFPNPAHTFLQLTEFVPDAQFEIYDVNGKLVSNGQTISKLINIQNLKTGLYFIKIKNRSTIINNKFIKY
jgi:hypothetical protein